VRVFLDTNVLVSALTTRGLCSEVLETVLVAHELVVAEPLFAELRRVLARKFRMPAGVITGYEELLRRQGESAAPGLLPPGLQRAGRVDRPDRILLACALGGKASLFATGDRQLVALKRVAALRVVGARECWQLLGGHAPRGSRSR